MLHQHCCTYLGGQGIDPQYAAGCAARLRRDFAPKDSLQAWRAAAKAGSKKPSQSASPRAAKWLGTSRDGYCQRTQDEGTCANGDKGSFSLAKELDWAAAAEACLNRCDQCARCRYISVSANFHDCSWFFTCNLARLQSDVPGFASGALVST